MLFKKRMLRLFSAKLLALLFLLIGCSQGQDSSVDCSLLTLEVSKSGCSEVDSQLDIMVQGGSAPYTFFLNNDVISNEGIIEGLESGTYNLKIIDDDGCEVSKNNIVINPSLSQDVIPIIELKCARSTCHLDTQEPLLVSRLGIIRAASRIEDQLQLGNMPPNGNITKSEMDVILDWIDCGAQNN